MERGLFVCNSVYQILVALWIKHTYLKNQVSDIIISDHLNNGEEICKKVIHNSEFEKSFFVESFAFSRHKVKEKKVNRIKQHLCPRKYLEKFIYLEYEYSNIYVANLDAFSQLLYDAQAHRNPEVKLFLFEDGMYTYSKLMEEDYNATAIQVDDCFHKILHRYVYRKRYIYNNISGLYVFNPQNMDWKVSFPLIQMKKIDCDDWEFKNSCNCIFGYYDSVDSYDRKYIFMEESFAAEGMPINDVELLNEISKRVGKENIMVKIHPRNPVNRFEKEGFLTNINTSIPWEVILMNLEDVSDKIFITVASSSVLNPILIFDKEIKVYSLYNLIDKEVYKSKLLSGMFWEIIYKMFDRYSNMITICNSINDIR